MVQSDGAYKYFVSSAESSVSGGTSVERTVSAVVINPESLSTGGLRRSSSVACRWRTHSKLTGRTNCCGQAEVENLLVYIKSNYLKYFQFMYHSLPYNCFFSPQQSQSWSVQKALKIQPTRSLILLHEMYLVYAYRCSYSRCFGQNILVGHMDMCTEIYTVISPNQLV